MIQWNDLPKEIQEKMLERQFEQSNGRKDPGVFMADIFSGFVWDNSKEKHSFWEEIIGNGNIDNFYTLYPKKEAAKKKTTIASLQKENEILRRKLEQIKEILQ